MEQGTTERGFNRAAFPDLYGTECSLQDSSLATMRALWFGVSKPELMIRARVAARMGREDLLKPPGDPERLNGWVAWTLPEQVLVTSRMHLSQEQVRELLPLLQHFVDYGELPGLPEVDAAPNNDSPPVDTDLNDALNR